MESQKGFKCSVCDVSMSSYEELEGHISSSHLNYHPYECFYCKFTKLPTEFYLNLHMKKVHQESEPKSIYCPDEKQKNILEKLIAKSCSKQDIVELNNKELSLDMKQEDPTPNTSRVGQSSKVSPVSAVSLQSGSGDRASKRRKRAVNPLTDDKSFISAGSESSPRESKSLSKTCTMCKILVNQCYTLRHCIVHHLNRKGILFCGYCDVSSKDTCALSKIKAHCEKVHQGKEVYVIDKREEYKAEIDRLFRRCFPNKSKLKVALKKNNTKKALTVAAAKSVRRRFFKKKHYAARTVADVPVLQTVDNEKPAGSSSQVQTGRGCRKKVKSKRISDDVQVQIHAKNSAPSPTTTLPKSLLERKLEANRAEYGGLKRKTGCPPSSAGLAKKKKKGRRQRRKPKIVAKKSSEGLKGSSAPLNDESDYGIDAEDVMDVTEGNEIEGIPPTEEGEILNAMRREAGESNGQNKELCWTPDNAGENVFVKKCAPGQSLDSTCPILEEKCELCGSEMRAKNTALHVMSMHTEQNKVFCVYCDYANKGSLSEIKTHLRENHPDSEREYRDCRVQFLDDVQRQYDICFPNRPPVTPETLGGEVRIASFEGLESDVDSDDEEKLDEGHDHQDSSECGALRKSPRKLATIPWRMMMKMEDGRGASGDSVTPRAKRGEKNLTESKSAGKQGTRSVTGGKEKGSEAAPEPNQIKANDKSKSDSADFSRVCAKCGKILGKGKGRRDHVIGIHIDLPLLRCALCDYHHRSSWSRASNHVKRVHGAGIDKIIDDRHRHKAEIDKIWLECFPDGADFLKKSNTLYGLTRWRNQRASLDQAVDTPSGSDKLVKTKPTAKKNVEVAAETVGNVVTPVKLPHGDVKLAEDVKDIKDKYRRARLN